jgi:hypothetical protein
MPFIDASLIKDFEAIAGDTFYFAFRLVDEDNAAIDLTGWSGWLEGLLSEDDAEPAISIRSGSGFTLGGAAGTVTAKALPAATDDWPRQSIPYRLKLQDAAGDVQTFFTGTIRVSAEGTA